MKSKALLALMELSLMILIFIFASALCLRGFLWSGQTSAESAALDRAVICAQNAAEQLKHSRGDLEEAAKSGGVREADRWIVAYDETWMETESPEAEVYRVTAVLKEQTVPGLGEARVEVTDRKGKVLFSIPAAWQEVIADEE